MPDRIEAEHLLAAAAGLLTGAGYRIVTSDAFGSARVFEDEASVVAIAQFDTVGELLERWPDVQADVADAMTSRWQRAEAKLWEGYLVLLCAATGHDQSAEITKVRYDTTRLRKLVISGRESENMESLERALGPLLPLRPRPTGQKRWTPLTDLPELVAQSGIPQRVAETAIEAYAAGRPMVEAIHRLVGDWR